MSLIVPSPDRARCVHIDAPVPARQIWCRYLEAQPGKYVLELPNFQRFIRAIHSKIAVSVLVNMEDKKLKYAIAKLFIVPDSAVV